MMRATFVGENGSMGFMTGATYWLRSSVDNNLIRIDVVDGRGYCYYDSIESFLANWALSSDKETCKDDKWDDF